MSNKVATKLSAMSTQFLDGISNTADSIKDAIGSQFGAGNVNKDVANTQEIIKKSPFETKSTTQEKLKRNPLGFSQIQYPIDLGNYDVGHYIIFMTISSRHSGQEANDLKAANKFGFGFEDGGNGKAAKSIRERKKAEAEFPAASRGSVLASFPTHKATTGAVSLYMPPGVKVSYKNSYEQEATEFSGDVLKGAAAIKNSAGFMDGMVETLRTGQIAGITYGKNLVGELVSMAGAGDPVKLTSKAFGMAINPQEEQFYTGPDFRSFTYDFDFHPRNSEELEAVRKIITLFKYHSAPGFTAEHRGRMFTVPSEFEIMYMNHGGENDYINKVGRVVCTSVDVDYGPEAQYSTFNNGAPTSYKLSLGFTETELVTKDKIMAGY